MNLIHDGTDAYHGFGELTNIISNNLDFAGIGTFDAFVSGGNLNLTFTPDSVTYASADVNILAYDFSTSGTTPGSYYLV